MKLSQMTEQEVAALTREQVANIVFGYEAKEPVCSEVGLLLGTRPGFCEERALQAAKLYREGKVRYICPSGGVEWELPDGRNMSEAYYMAEILRKNGVPEEAILIENEARTTKENMICGTLVINRVLHLQNVKSICIVTSANHMRRSLALAKLLLPRSVEIFGSASNVPEDPITYLEDEKPEIMARKGIDLMKVMIDHGMIDDIEL